MRTSQPGLLSRARRHIRPTGHGSDGRRATQQPSGDLPGIQCVSVELVQFVRTAVHSTLPKYIPAANVKFDFYLTCLYNTCDGRYGGYGAKGFRAT